MMSFRGLHALSLHVVQIIIIVILLCQGMETGTAGKSLAAHSSVDHRITVALNLLSWLCDGQKRNMQDILREQKLFAVRPNKFHDD